MVEKLLLLGFRLHSVLFTWLSRHIRTVKTVILIVAHASLIGLFFPEMRTEFGEMSLNILIVILFLSPAAAITRMPLLLVTMGFRRELGILVGYLAMVHGLGYFIDPVSFALSIAPYLPGDILSIDPILLLGIAALVLLFPLLLTSNAFALRTLGGVRWKRLHTLVYPMFVLVVLHRFMASGGLSGGMAEVGEVILLLGGYSLLKFLAWKPESFLFLRRILSSIGERYRRYQFSGGTVSSSPSSL